MEWASATLAAAHSPVSRTGSPRLLRLPPPPPPLLVAPLVAAPVRMPLRAAGGPVPIAARCGRETQKYGERGERLVAG